MATHTLVSITSSDGLLPDYAINRTYIGLSSAMPFDKHAKTIFLEMLPLEYIVNQTLSNTLNGVIFVAVKSTDEFFILRVSCSRLIKYGRMQFPYHGRRSIFRWRHRVHKSVTVPLKALRKPRSDSMKAKLTSSGRVLSYIYALSCQ